jgi:hypothetical protein
LVIGELCQVPGIGNNQPFGFGDKLLELHFFLRRNGPLAVLLKQPVETAAVL